MIETLSLRNFRGFRELNVEGLGQVNLFVGRNNCGKTSVLEAIQMFVSRGDPLALWHTARRRGERILEKSNRRADYIFDFSHLFHGHEINSDSRFSISDQSQQQFIATVKFDESSIGPSGLFDEESGESEHEEERGDPYVLDLAWIRPSDHFNVSIPMTIHGGVDLDNLRRYRPFPTSPNVRIITTAALSPPQVSELFDQVVLTPEEEAVVESLKTIDPRIQRIATASEPNRRYTQEERGGMFVKCEGIDQRIPIGTMGDGIWRMLGLSLALARAEGGVLLVDEIDTGLHYSVMDSMWRLVSKTARRLNVQVFATSHSRDCFESLAVVAREASQIGVDLSIQRIEKDQQRALAFSETEIVIAAERGLEVR